MRQRAIRRTAAVLSVSILAILILTVRGTPSSAQGITREVGSVPIALPAPEGFTEVCSQDETILEIMESVVPPNNLLLGCFVPGDEYSKYIAGELGSFDRYLSVQSFKPLAEAEINAEMFSLLRTEIRTNYTRHIESVQPETREILDSADDLLSKLSGEDVAISMDDVIPLSIFRDDENSIAYSMLTRQSVRVGEEDVTSLLAVASTIARIKGKILYLYYYKTVEQDAEVKELNTLAEGWVDLVLDENRAPRREGGDDDPDQGQGDR